MIKKYAAIAIFIQSAFLAQAFDSTQWRDSYSLERKNSVQMLKKRPLSPSINFATQMPLTSLNPFSIVGESPAFLTYLLFDTLLDSYPNSNSYYGVIAKKFKKELNKVTFQINAEARWNANQYITPEDIKFSYNTLAKYSPYYRSNLGFIQSIKITGNNITFISKNSIREGEFLTLATMPIFIKDQWSKVNFNKPLLNTNIIGSGSYSVKEFKSNQYVLLQKKDNYWANNLKSRIGLFNFKLVRFTYIKLQKTAIYAIEKGNLSALLNPNPGTIAMTNRQGFKNAKLVKLKHNRISPLVGFFVNSQSAILKNKNLRKALLIAFDPRVINKLSFNNTRDIAYTVFYNSPYSYQNHWYMNMINDTYTNKLKLIESIMTQEGYCLEKSQWHDCSTKQELILNLLINNNDDKLYASILQQQLKNIGIRLIIHSVPPNRYKYEMQLKGYDITFSKVISSKPPKDEQLMYWQGGEKSSHNITNIDNKEINGILEELRGSSNPSKWAKELDKLVQNQYIFLPIPYSAYDNAVINNQIRYPNMPAITWINPFTWWQEQ